MKEKENKQPMKKDFEDYKRFCMENKLTESKFESLVAYFDDQKKEKSQDAVKTPQGDYIVNVRMPLTAFDKLEIIEDFILWIFEEGDAEDLFTGFIKYKRYLMEDF